MTRLYEIVSFH